MHSNKELAHFNLTAASSSRSGGACIPSCHRDDDQVEDKDQVEDGDQVEDEDEDEDEVETEDEYAGGYEDGGNDEHGNKDEDEPEDEVQGEGETFVTSAHCRADELFESSLAANCNGGIENQ